MQYHKMTQVVSRLINADRNIHIVDRMIIISNVNEYILGIENRIIELENEIKKINQHLVQNPPIKPSTIKIHAISASSSSTK